MKNYVKNTLIGLIIGLILVPITFVELYYFGGETAYITEIIYFKNFINIFIVMPIFGVFVGITTRFLGNIIMKFDDKEFSIKRSLILGLKLLIYIIIIVFLLSIISELLMTKISETVISLIILNITITIIFLIIGSIVIDSIRIRKINKKLKENKE